MRAFRGWWGMGKRMRTTPGRLRLQVALVAAATLALLVTGAGALASVLVTETNVHQGTVTAIVGIQRMHSWLAAADRSAANSYLSGGAELTLPQQQYEADIAAAIGTISGAAGARDAIARSQGQYARLLELWQARSLAYDANGATSLYLISVAPDEAFQANAARLVDRPLTDDLLTAARHCDVRFDGLLADELRAANSRAERDAALRVVAAYRQFQAIDASVHAQAAAGHQSAAVTLTLGTYGAPLGLAFKSMNWGPRLGAQRDWSEGALGFAFEEFDWDLAQLKQLLQNEFDATMMSVERLLAETLGLQALSLVVAALTFSGLRPRIAEYLV